MSRSWSKIFVRSALTKWLVDDAVREANGAIAADIESVLRAEVESISQVNRLKKALASVKRDVSSSTFESLAEELSEIREDFTWARSGRGKYVSAVQDWVQSFHAEMRSDVEFDGLYVGGHASIEVVYIAGKAQSEAVLNRFVEFISSKNPPRKIMTNVKIIRSDADRPDRANRPPASPW
jgi:hypothetical protein